MIKGVIVNEQPVRFEDLPDDYEYCSPFQIASITRHFAEEGNPFHVTELTKCPKLAAYGRTFEEYIRPASLMNLTRGNAWDMLVNHYADQERYIVQKRFRKTITIFEGTPREVSVDITGMPDMFDTRTRVLIDNKAPKVNNASKPVADYYVAQLNIYNWLTGWDAIELRLDTYGPTEYKYIFADLWSLDQTERFVIEKLQEVYEQCQMAAKIVESGVSIPPLCGNCFLCKAKEQPIWLRPGEYDEMKTPKKKIPSKFIF